MVFESYAGPPSVEPGDLFIGYFLGPRADQTLEVQPGFVELIAWDRTKRVFNFWELIENGWHYRGDSNDVLADVAKVNAGANPPIFRRPGTAAMLRLSHAGGANHEGAGSAPQRLVDHRRQDSTSGPFGFSSGTTRSTRRMSPAALFRGAADASDLSQLVKAGIDRLVAVRSETVPAGSHAQAAARDRWSATMEMNLVSDSAPLNDAARRRIEIPQDFFVDARLVGDRRPISVDKAIYRRRWRRLARGSRPVKRPISSIPITRSSSRRARTSTTASSTRW